MARRSKTSVDAELYRTCLRGAFDAFVIADAEGFIREVNPAFEAMTGYDASEAVGRRSSFLKSERTSQESLREMRDTLARGRPWRGRLCSARKDGSELHCGLTIAPILGPDGRVSHYFSVMRDITEALRNAEQIRELTRKREEFLSIATHDLRRPIGNLQMFARMLLDGTAGPLVEKQRETVQRMRANVDYMLELVEDLLSTQVAEAGALVLYPARVDVCDLLRACVARHAMAAHDKEIHVQVRHSGGESTLMADGDRLVQAVNNLLSNAIKFSPVGSAVTIEHGPERHGYSIAVIDQGVGIPAEETGRLFQKYARLSPRPTKGEKSTGLGLFIVQTIVKLHHGKVTVRSQPGEGSTFRLWLPERPPGAEAPGLSPSSGLPGA